MRLADYVMSFLADRGIKHVFLVTGGGAMHLNDAVGREKRWTWVCCHHEQACAIAAESYARFSQKIALVNVTTGPGGVNALNGVYGAFVDSIPMFVVSGQVKRETIAGNTGLPLRQLGDQEVDIVSMVKCVTKYAVCVQNPAEIRYHLEKAWYLATTGRPGPVWIDIPIDVQSTRLDVTSLCGFSPDDEGSGVHFGLAAEAGWLAGAAIDAEIDHVLARLASAKRPVILAGTGVRCAGARALLLAVGDALRIPITTGWNAHDLVPNDHICYAGRPGTVGDRQGNFTVQNSDFLLVLGCRLNIRQVSYNWKAFARDAYTIMVDIDTAEMRKPTLRVDRPIHADVKEFLEKLAAATGTWTPRPDHQCWLEWCARRGTTYSVVQPEYEQSSLINPYIFMRDLFEALDEDEVIIAANGTASVVSCQGGRIKSNTRLYGNSGCASMGYDLPGAIGAYYAASRRIICLAGEGSVMMNLQELQTIVGLWLPVKLFILNNGGYHSIRQTQTNYFPDNEIGVGATTGVTFPDFVRLAEALGIPARHCDAPAQLPETLRFALDHDGPILVEVSLDQAQGFSPKLASRVLPDGTMASSALEDMAPFLSRAELADNMFIPLME